MSTDRFTYSVIASLLHDPAAVNDLTAPIRSLMDDIGGDRTLSDPATPSRQPLPHLYLVATGGTEHVLLDDVEHRRRFSNGEPVMLIAHGAHNSLPAAMETLAAVQQGGNRGRIVFLTGDDSADRYALDEAVTDLEAIIRMRSTRLGLVGGSSSWLVASSPAIGLVQHRWGPRVQIVDSDRLIDLARTAPVALTTKSASQFACDSGHVGTTLTAQAVTAQAITEASAVTTAMRELVTTEELDAVAVRCFDLLDNPGTSGCLALASLNDAGVVAGCEGDIPSTLGMLMIRYLLDQPSWMANPAHVDVGNNRVVLAHCTVAPSMVDSFALATHFESGRGVGIAGRFEHQPVTLIRIGGVELNERWIAQGQIIGNGDDPHLCRTQVTVEIDDRAVTDLLDHPLGNHLALATGHHAERLERWMNLAIAS